MTFQRDSRDWSDPRNPWRVCGKVRDLDLNPALTLAVLSWMTIHLPHRVLERISKSIPIQQQSWELVRGARPHTQLSELHVAGPAEQN